MFSNLLHKRCNIIISNICIKKSSRQFQVLSSPAKPFTTVPISSSIISAIRPPTRQQFSQLYNQLHGEKHASNQELTRAQLEAIANNYQKKVSVSNSSPRLLCIDHGLNYIGLSITDVTNNFIEPLYTIDKVKKYRTFINKELKAIEEINDLIQKYNICAVVIGLPLTLDSKSDQQTKIAIQFANQFQLFLKQNNSLFKSISVYLWDERFSTASARQLLSQKKGIPKQNALQNKEYRAALNRVSACNILQSFVDEMEFARQPDSSATKSNSII